MKYVIYSDGGARGNPGPAAYGFLIRDENLQTLAETGEYLGRLTNNQAEYEGVIHAFKWVWGHRNLFAIGTDIEVRLDSDLLVNQLKGAYKIKSPGLKKLSLIAKDLEKTIGIPIHYVHVPREKNKDADRLVNRALDFRNEANRNMKYVNTGKDI